jgi:1-acyl-sn-glycerol-3-phosphate acyltransferase
MSRRPTDLSEKVSTVVAEVLGEAPAPDAPLVLDSLATAELAFALEEAFGLRLPDDIRFGTVAEVTAHVARAVDRPQRPRSALGNGFGRFHGPAAAAVKVATTRYYRLSVTGADRVPRTGSAVLAANHDSLIDIPILLSATRRPVWFMAKEELFRGAVTSRFFRALGGFPVRRAGPDLEAVRAALEVLRRGRLLGMYPESTRTAELLPFYPGAAWLALATDARLVPVAIRGTLESMPRGSTVARRTNVTVRFGEPLRPGREADPRARLERAREVTADLRVEVEKLLAQ